MFVLSCPAVVSVWSRKPFYPVRDSWLPCHRGNGEPLAGLLPVAKPVDGNRRLDDLFPLLTLHVQPNLGLVVRYDASKIRTQHVDDGIAGKLLFTLNERTVPLVDDEAAVPDTVVLEETYDMV
jgi:hypothetical protein